MMLVYYVDSAGLKEGNRELAAMSCEECLEKKCAGGKSYDLWRLPDVERLRDFIRRAEAEQWAARIFWAKTRDAKPEQIAAADIDALEEKFKSKRDHRKPARILGRKAGGLVLAH